MSEVPRISDNGAHPDEERTLRGFQIYGRIPTTRQHPATIRVEQSSLAGRGAHVWLVIEGECRDHPVFGTHLHPCPHLNVENTLRPVAALCVHSPHLTTVREVLRKHEEARAK